MATIAHASLTGAELHILKGADTALVGQVPVANGLGDSVWTSISSTAFTGMIADFLTPVAPTGWLECDGSTVSSATYASLYAVMTLAFSATTTNGTKTVTSIGSTTNLHPGYFVFGTGVASGTTIASVDSSSQVTLSANATVSGTNTLTFSPWLLNTGTIQLPDLCTNQRFRRARVSGGAVGVTQADTINAHTHHIGFNTGVNNVDHTHAYSGTTSGTSNDHTHQFAGTPTSALPTAFGANYNGFTNSVNSTTTGQSADHTHTYSGNTGNPSQTHVHAISGTSDQNSGAGTETRPINITCITCVKT